MMRVSCDRLTGRSHEGGPMFGCGFPVGSRSCLPPAIGVRDGTLGPALGLATLGIMVYADFFGRAWQRCESTLLADGGGVGRIDRVHGFGTDRRGRIGSRLPSS